MPRKKIIKKKFEDDFDEIFDYINENSPQNAIKFAEELDVKIEEITINPTAFPPEKTLPTKRNWYRFSKLMKSWKILYKVTNKVLVFLSIVHSKRHSKEIEKLRTNKYD